MKFILGLLIYLCIHGMLSAQSDSVLLPIDTVRIEAVSKSFTPSYTISSKTISRADLEHVFPIHLSDALSHVAGVYQLNNGNAISKPIVRGLGGSRLLILYNGIRFGNQQWQDEHGLGLSQIGIGSVEIIKGPLSLLYGSDAIGGVLRISDEDFTADNRSHRDVNCRFFSNTGGTLTDAGWKANRGKLSWIIRVGADSHGDYQDGKNLRIINSRYNGVYVKAGIKWIHNRWNGNVRYHFVRNRFGFILPDENNQLNAGSRYERSFTGPNHEVYFNLLSNENIFALRNSILRINFGIQSNQRMEDEGGGSVSLNMFLFSSLAHVIWEKPLNQRWKLIASQQNSREQNVNLGKRILIPDAITTEINSAVMLRRTTQKTIFEAGGSYLTKGIDASATGINGEGEILLRAFRVKRSAQNYLAGFTWQPFKCLSLRINASTGVRAPNLAELASNGLREGTYRYELGSIALKNEVSTNSDAGCTFVYNRIKIETGVFYQAIRNFIYLQPTAEQILGFQVFEYRQTDAILRGGEIEGSFGLSKSESLLLKSSLSMVLANQRNGDPLPMTPPFRTMASLQYKWPVSRNLNLNIEPGISHFMAQDKIAPQENRTPAYTLFNAMVSTDFPWQSRMVSASMGINNLLNRYYYDHLSLVKNYGIYNMGRNIVLSIRISW